MIGCAAYLALGVAFSNNLVFFPPFIFTNFKKDGVVPDHWAIVAMLMGVMADNALDFKEPLGRIEIDQKKARGSAAKGRFGGSKQIDLDIGAVNG